MFYYLYNMYVGEVVKVSWMFIVLYASGYLCNIDLVILDFVWLGNK